MDYEQLKKVTMDRSKAQSQYVRNNLMGNSREHSNGESAILYFEEKIKENALYLLDEPENRPFSRTPARTSSVHRRFLEVLWVPVRNRNTFSVPAIDEGGQDI